MGELAQLITAIATLLGVFLSIYISMGNRKAIAKVANGLLTKADEKTDIARAETKVAEKATVKAEVALARNEASKN